MIEDIYRSLTHAIRDAVNDRYGVELAELPVEIPPQPKLGDLAFTVAFDLARKVRQAPRTIAGELLPVLESVAGIERVEVAGPGYLNVFLDRRRHIDAFLATPDPVPSSHEKVIVEHTNINPNKAAHIGHLRNAALGDSFVRILRYCGDTVEVQNYIDDTGVQVADVVVGFLHLQGKDLAEVEAVADSERFDYYCWDLYARVNEFYAADTTRQSHRERTLQAIESGSAPEAPLAKFIATRIARCHLRTMERIGVRYDLLPWEGDILRLRFWDRAFELLKQRGAIRKSTAGKNQGCWVMDLPDEPDSEDGDEKVIVRSNGTVTYVGKDIAYQLWKLGLLDRDFHYFVFFDYSDGATVWSTTSDPLKEAVSGLLRLPTTEGDVSTSSAPVEGGGQPPSFGGGARVYNVIDTRQSYLQRIVQQGVALIASEQARERSRHFSYEMVALTPSTCRELGFPVSEEEARKPYLEVSGRRGLGVKADDLMDVLERKALEEVRERNPDTDDAARAELARAIARGALRYFMIKYTKNKVIAFDFAEALNFEGDSGPYLQYAMVRANKIIQKIGLDTASDPISMAKAHRSHVDWRSLPPAEGDDLWGLILSSTRLGHIAEQVQRTEEPAHLARFALQLAQKFNAFYHNYPVLRESDPVKRSLRLLAVNVFRRQMARALELMGIPVPERM